MKDKATSIALDDVSCKVTSRKDKLVHTTDSTGKFDLCNEFGSCLFGCKEITIEFSKSGYKTVRETNSGKDAVIFLEK